LIARGILITAAAIIILLGIALGGYIAGVWAPLQ